MLLLTKVRGWWTDFMEWMTSPWATFEKAKKSPVTWVLVIVFIVQPVANFGLSLYQAYEFGKQEFHPEDRPVTEAEFNLMNIKIDALQASSIEEGVVINSLVAKDRQALEDAKKRHEDAIVKYVQAQENLTGVQKKLDADYIQKSKIKIAF